MGIIIGIIAVAFLVGLVSRNKGDIFGHFRFWLWNDNRYYSDFRYYRVFRKPIAV